MYQFHKFILSWNSACFGQFVCPSSGVYSLYTQQWYMSYRFVDSICSCSTAVYKPVWHIPFLSVQWINSWWWTYELSETCRVSWQNKFVKLVHLVRFITKKFVTMHGHMNVKKTLLPTSQRILHHKTCLHAHGSNIQRRVRIMYLVTKQPYKELTVLETSGSKQSAVSKLLIPPQHALQHQPVFEWLKLRRSLTVW